MDLICFKAFILISYANMSGTKIDFISWSYVRFMCIDTRMISFRDLCKHALKPQFNDKRRIENICCSFFHLEASPHLLAPSIPMNFPQQIST